MTPCFLLIIYQHFGGPYYLRLQGDKEKLSSFDNDSEMTVFIECNNLMMDCLCGLVVRVSGYRYRGLGFDSRRYQIY